MKEEEEALDLGV